MVAEAEGADFNEVGRLLTALGADWDPAEAHGAFCGRACFEGAAALANWLADVLPAVDANNVLAREQQSRLQAAAAHSLLSLEAGQMAFAVLLPDDDAPLALRAEALADWCHGFMQGFTSVGKADEGPYADELDSAVVDEILEDFSAITRATAGERASEADESALAELTEYVRVSAQLVYEETAAQRLRLKQA